MSSKQTFALVGALVVALVACGGAPSERRFPLRDPLWRDTDLASVNVRCHPEPTRKDPRHVSCAPASYASPIYWDGTDSLVFRPLTDVLGVVTSGESVNVNSVDEVPDSAWFQSRLAVRAVSDDELRAGACSPDQLLDPASAADGTWVIDKGKGEGSTPGFRVIVPGKGKYMLKSDAPQDRQPERMAAASKMGASIYHAVGYYVSCEQIIYVRPSLLKLTPGLTTKGNFEEEKAFDQRALDELLANGTKRNGLVRFSASAWLPGHSIGPFRFEGVRDDDPNDVIRHEDRRELRGLRVLAAWIGRHDAREANSLDSWFADDPKKDDSSPGHVVHYQLDVSETLGSMSLGGGSDPVAQWNWDTVARRLGASYVLDWADIGADLVTLGIPLRHWDRVTATPGREIFGYFNVRDFVPDEWKPMYPNAAFSRMTERDAAWMARILARFTPKMIRTLAEAGDFSAADNTAYIASVLEGRLERVLDRYLTRLSPIADLRVEGGDRLCGVDLADKRGVRDSVRFHYAAQYVRGPALAVTRKEGGELCVTLRHVGQDYLRVMIEDSVARGPLVAHLYDLGPQRGFRLVGLERPERAPR